MTRGDVRRLDDSIEVLVVIAQGIGGDSRRLDCLIRGCRGNGNPGNSATLALDLLCDPTTSIATRCGCLYDGQEFCRFLTLRNFRTLLFSKVPLPLPLCIDRNIGLGSNPLSKVVQSLLPPWMARQSQRSMSTAS
jgi:hypothetical protein